MVTGKLKRNKRREKRNFGGNYPKLKVLSGEDITFEKIYSRYNCGCLVTLDDINKLNKSENKGIVHEVNWEKRKIIYAFSIKEGLSLEEYFFENTKKPNSYHINAYQHIPNHQIYNELNKKIQMANQN